MFFLHFMRNKSKIAVQIYPEAINESKNSFSIEKKGRLYCKEKAPVHAKGKTGIHYKEESCRSCKEKEASILTKGKACLSGKEET